MNHGSTVRSISSQANLLSHLASYNIPFILGETNSLYNEGAPGLSNSFGAALWGVDFNLWCASVGIRRVHMHQGTDYRYASWQPIPTKKTSIGTKPPYYGNVAVGAMLGNLTAGAVRIANVPLNNSYESAYAAYVNEKLVRIVVINMQEYNYTVNGTSIALNPAKRPSKEYAFQVPDRDEVGVQRLYANGSDAITGISWDGWSYNWELNQGKPVRLGNMTTGETVRAEDGRVKISVEDSTAVILSF